MNKKTAIRGLCLIAGLTAATPALAHPDAGSGAALMSALAHPFTGLDHILAMIAVSLWAALRGGKAVSAWPAAFLLMMAGGAGLAMAGVALPLVEAGILASVVILGLLVATAARLPVAAGAGLVGLFALMHGQAHGLEAAAAGSVLVQGAGFMLATAALLGGGMLLGRVARAIAWTAAARIAGATVASAGVALSFGL